MTTDTGTTRNTSRACTLGGLAAVALGLAAFLSGGGGGHVVELAGQIAGMSGNELAALGVAVAVVGLGLGAAIFGEMVILGALVVALVVGVGGLMVFLLGSSALGWSRLVGLSIVESSPAIGSPATGLGALAVAAGLVALAYCRTPLIVSPEETANEIAASDKNETDPAETSGEAADQDRPTEGEKRRGRPADERKFNAAMAVGVFLVFIPGLIAAAYPGRDELRGTNWLGARPATLGPAVPAEPATAADTARRRD
jgi:hypothetical protein